VSRPAQDPPRLVIGEVGQDLGGHEVPLRAGQGRGAEQVGRQLGDGPGAILDEVAHLRQPPPFPRGDRLGPPGPVAERRPVAGQDQIRTEVAHPVQGLQVGPHRIGFEAPLERHRRGDHLEQVIAGAEQPLVGVPEAHVPGRVPRRVHDLPRPPARGEVLPTVEQPGGTADRRHERHPVPQPFGALRELGSVEAVVGEQERAAVDRLVRIGVLLQVQVGTAVHPQLTAAAPHDLTGEAEVVDVGVSDHEPLQQLE
jgi:hypothetical protein